MNNKLTHDNSVNNITLWSMNKTNLLAPYIYDDNITDFIIDDFFWGEGVALSNNDGTQYLFLQLVNGSVGYMYGMAFIIYSNEHVFDKIIQTDIDYFKTGAGAYLGMDISYFNKFRSLFNIREDNTYTEFWRNDSDSIPYECHYCFRNNKLIKIIIGYVP